MEHIRFDWDKEKNLSNQKKHGISFEEAQTVFIDENALMIHDPDHSGDEDRFILLGLSASIRLMVVCHCYESADSADQPFPVAVPERAERPFTIPGALSEVMHVFIFNISCGTGRVAHGSRAVCDKVFPLGFRELQH